MRMLLVVPALLSLLTACGQQAPQAAQGGNTAQPATAVAETPSADAMAAKRQVTRYFERIAARDFARAHAFWADGGKSSGGSVADLKRAFEPYAKYAGTAGDPTEVKVSGDTAYIIVPATAEATIRKTGVMRDLSGMVYLKRSVAPKGGDAAAGDWRIWAVDLRRAH
ncbi:hypothetical protein [Sphingomonas sp.]|uniref:hypothetical protein n=1 Tax=Sphingomonas sp. TaxID=28214 RepID=UPI001ED620E1|nr:hypothetical protein [Sphingomonas sp.]MBX3595224.1 hypothetical protein [Sphingomonas sp.]